MAQLPNMFGRLDQNTGNRPQTPQIPNPTGGAMGGLQSASAGPQGNRPVFSQMGPDNGQHGGRRRYMTPESGAMMQSQLQQQNGQMPPLSMPNNNTQPTQPYPSQRGVYGGSGGMFNSGVLQRPAPHPMSPVPPGANPGMGLPWQMNQPPMQQTPNAPYTQWGPGQSPYEFIGPGGT